MHCTGHKQQLSPVGFSSKFPFHLFLFDLPGTHRVTAPPTSVHTAQGVQGTNRGMTKRTIPLCYLNVRPSLGAQEVTGIIKQLSLTADCLPAADEPSQYPRRHTHNKLLRDVTGLGHLCNLSRPPIHGQQAVEWSVCASSVCANRCAFDLILAHIPHNWLLGPSTTASQDYSSPPSVPLLRLSISLSVSPLDRRHSAT